MTWLDVMPVGDLGAQQKRVVRIDGRQILFLRTADRIVACPNRCPHEGYPLAEGDCSGDGKLRCNWHINPAVNIITLRSSSLAN